MTWRNILKASVDKYSEIAIYVQRRNDLDTCSCACALAEAITLTFGESKKVSIIGLTGKSSFLPEAKKHDNKPIDWSKDVLVVLSEISSLRQISKKDIEDIKKAKSMILLDHHVPDNELELKGVTDLMSDDKNKLVCGDPSYSSATEVLWECLKQSEWEINARIAEMIFMGIYGDTKGLTDENIHPRTFESIHEIAKRGVNIGECIKRMKRKPLANLKVFADCVSNGEQDGNMLILSLNPKMVQKNIPRLFFREKGGRIKQRCMLTYIPRWVEEYSDVNTIVFLHYSLFDPYDSTKRFVYIQLLKENPALEHVLKEHGFKRNRNRWSREMTFYNLMGLIENYRSIFVA